VAQALCRDVIAGQPVSRCRQADSRGVSGVTASHRVIRQADGRKVSYRTREAAMYSNVNYEIAKARIADMHQEAQRDAVGRTVRAGRASKQRSPRPALRFPLAAARRVLTVLVARA
jgi:hypothetical protein